jgi:predicted dinucleotide-binding enzyme
MKGKVILHTNNPIFNLDMNFAQALSSSEVLALLLPDSHIVRLFNPLHSLKTSNSQNVDKTKIFFTAENYRIKKNVEIYLETLNFAAIELVD